MNRRGCRQRLRSGQRGFGNAIDTLFAGGDGAGDGLGRQGRSNGANARCMRTQESARIQSRPRGKRFRIRRGRARKSRVRNPAQEIGMTRQAAEMTQHAATAGLIRARNWESTWIEGVYVRRDQPLLTLTVREREDDLFAANADDSGRVFEEDVWGGNRSGAGTPRQWDDGGEGSWRGLRRGKDSLLQRTRWRRWAMRSWDMKFDMTSANATDCGRGRYMRSSEI